VLGKSAVQGASFKGSHLTVKEFFAFGGELLCITAFEKFLNKLLRGRKFFAEPFVEDVL
jgi:hypothetical protein